ncbi:MAG: tetratricopeptide repeat protein, partial [Candidatus Zixiibacteriota bacterium]
SLRLLAFACANQRQYREAEEASRRGLELNPDDRDFHFALAYVYAGYKDYEKCLRHGEIFLELSKKQSKVSNNTRFLSDGHHHLLYNYLGLAWQSAGKTDKAEESFLTAISYNKAYHHPYINLASMYQRLKEYDEAEKIIDSGLKKCSQVQELRILKKNLKYKATVSACMMVKNEEELLPTCLESIRNWVDEIIIVDTGSTDRTIEIARSYGARVFSQKWSKDFSKHRNYSISKATCDWIFIIDADEEFIGDDLPELRRAINQENFRIVSISVLNTDKKTGECTSFLPSPRLFKRDAGFHYEGIVHNQLQFPGNEPILRVGARIKHYGYNLSHDLKMKKVARSRELLEKQLEISPDDPFVHFNYAQLLRGITKKPDSELADLILRHAARAVELSDPRNRATLPLHLQGLHQQATVLIAAGRFEEAVEKCRQALETKPDYLDALYTMAEAYGRMQDFNQAEKYFNKYLDEQKKYDPAKEDLSIILLFGFMRHRAYYSLGLIHQIQGNLAQAENYYKKALAEQDPCLDINLKLADIYLNREEADKAWEYIEKELALNPSSDLANLYKARYYALTGNEEKAASFLERAIELTDDRPEIYEVGGLFWAARKKYDKAVRLLVALVQTRPDYPEGYNILARTYYDQGDFSSSIEIYEKYISMSPHDSDAYNDLAGCYFKLGNYDKAEEIYVRALELNEDLMAACRNLGLTRLRMNKLSEALPLLEKYMKMAPDDVVISLAVGSIYQQLERYSEAIPHFERFLTVNPNNIQALFNISECYYNLGYADSAAIGYLQILKINPDFQPAKNRLLEIETPKAPA